MTGYDAVADDALSGIIGHHLQAGVGKNWLPYGNTTADGDFGELRNDNVGALLQVDPGCGQLVTRGTLSQTEVVRWGYGIEQTFDAAGLLLYAQAHHYEPRIIGFSLRSRTSRGTAFSPGGNMSGELGRSLD